MTLYLINAPARAKPRAKRKARKTTTTRSRKMARKMPARNAKGRFVKGGRATTARRRRTTTTRAAAPRRRRTTYRRNPPRKGDIMGRVTTGLLDGLQVMLGKAGARAVPTLLKLPTTGTMGIGVQLASAVAVGMVAEQFVSRDAARMIVAGGVSAPLEALVISYNVPFLAPALTTGALSGYPQGGPLVGYPRQHAAPARLAGYPQGSNPRMPLPFVARAGTGAGSF